MDLELACDRVSKLLLEVAIDLRLNQILKTSSLFTLRIARSNSS